MKARKSKNNLKKQLSKMTQNLNTSLSNIPKDVEKELIKVGFDIQADAMAQTPVVTGNLRAGAYTMFDGASPANNIQDNADESQNFDDAIKKAQNKIRYWKNRAKMVIVGFSASYAVYIHGNPNAGKSEIPGSSTVGNWQFLTNAIRKNNKKVLKRLAKAGEL